MVDPRNDAETRRQGIVGLAERPAGLGPQYAVVYADIVQKPNDPLLRATALRALNRARDPQYTGLFVENLKDPNNLVRLEACKALNRLPDVKAVPELLAIAAKPDEDKDIRIAAAEALRHYKRADAARALAGLLADRDFSIVFQARKSLADLTKKDFGYDQSAWLNYLTKPDKPLL
jgi:HEAT repeat protein